MVQKGLVEDKSVKRSVELFKDYHCKKCGSAEVDVFVSDNSLCLKCDDCNERVIFKADDKKQGALEELKFFRDRYFLFTYSKEEILIKLLERINELEGLKE